MVLKNFIAFEGIDGSGTTTQLGLLAQACQGRQQAIHFTQEPTDGPIGQLIRQVLAGTIHLHEKTLAYLFGADRCEHLYGVNGIQAQLAAGKAVVSDRYVFSSLAYQGLTAGDALAVALNGPFPLPEYLFFFDIPVDAALKRVKNRRGTQEVYENAAFQHEVAEQYKTVLLRAAQAVPEMRVVRIDAMQKIEETHKIIWSIVKDLPKVITE
ncbi:MAG: dTMP kinase [Treponema sp.]